MFSFNAMMETAKKIERYNRVSREILPQTWKLPHENVITTEAFALNRFTKRPNAKRVILINPPYAGHHSNLAERVIKQYLDTTDHEIYAIDHLAATEETANQGIEEIIDRVRRSVELILLSYPDIEKIDLRGLCQGGWANVIYAALYPEFVASLIIAGTPIDFQVDGGKLPNYRDMTRESGIVDAIIGSNKGVWPGKYQLLGFKALNPADRYIGTYLDLWRAIESGDEVGIKKWRRNNSWYETVLDMPGKFIKEVLSDLFDENKLIKGQLKVYGRTVDLKNITCPVVCITGGKDDITLPRQCTAIFQYVSSDEKFHHHIDGAGHIAVFLSGPALAEWREADQEIEDALYRCKTI